MYKEIFLKSVEMLEVKTESSHLITNNCRFSTLYKLFVGGAQTASRCSRKIVQVPDCTIPVTQGWKIIQ